MKGFGQSGLFSKRFRSAFFQSCSGIAAWHKVTDSKAASETRTLSGRRRQWPFPAKINELLNTVRSASYTATCGHKDQVQENPPEDEQEEEGMATDPLLVVEPLEEKVENNNSASPWPQDGQSTLSFSSLRRHRYSKIWAQLLHLNS